MKNGTFHICVSLSVLPQYFIELEQKESNSMRVHVS